MQNAVSNAPVSRVDQPFGPEAEKDATDICEAGEIQLGMMPSTGSVNMQPHQQDRAWTEHTVLKPVAGKLKPKTTGTPKRHRTSRLEKAGGRKLAPAATVTVEGVEPHSDELPLLGAENRRLKQLLAEHLTQQNAQLRTMLKRFERG
ncbi:hypothetical protein [Rhizobium tumorigenes]|nr:hypothetical protein [Rhizobium tumorigenes]WFS03409.1 hypothetical protein PR016_19110 [Rhizobium tumorigenes]